MSLESPRMVTAANHWAAFPTAVFSGSGIVEQKLHPTTPKSRQKQRQQQQANLPLMPKSEGLTGGQTKLLLPRNNGNRTGKFYHAHLHCAGLPSPAGTVFFRYIIV